MCRLAADAQTCGALAGVRAGGRQRALVFHHRPAVAGCRARDRQGLRRTAEGKNTSNAGSVGILVNKIGYAGEALKLRCRISDFVS